jgi:Protein of unknown function (DUF2695)
VGRPDKAERKAIKKRLRDQDLVKERVTLPVDLDQLLGLLDYVDARLEACDESFRLTRAYLDGRRLDSVEVIDWLEEHGAFCDCEVLNTADLLFELAGRGPQPTSRTSKSAPLAPRTVREQAASPPSITSSRRLPCSMTKDGRASIRPEHLVPDLSLKEPVFVGIRSGRQYAAGYVCYVGQDVTVADILDELRRPIGKEAELMLDELLRQVSPFRIDNVISVSWHDDRLELTKVADHTKRDQQRPLP